MIDLKTIIEGLLFIADSPLSLEKLSGLLEDPTVDLSQIKGAIDRLNEEYEESKRAFSIRNVAGGYQMRTIKDLAPFALRLKRETPTKLSKSALEILAVVAYRQPVLRAEVEKIRGVDSGLTIRTLLDKELIRVSGRRDGLPGRPMLYCTTKKFLETFDLSDLSDLPTIEEIKKITPPPKPRLF